ncbi:MAG: hypothetical protein WBG73_07875 [Coleofasciculaceae cyanobacterium]
MKLTFSSKTICSIALIAVIYSPTLQKPANAQTQPAQNACSIASAQVPEGVFDGVNLSTEQFAAYDAVIKRHDEQVTSRLDAKAKRVIKPDAFVLFLPQRGLEIPTQVQEAITNDVQSSKPAQIDSLTAKYGQYGRFIPETTLVYDQKLYEEFQKESQVLQNQILAVMKPEQRQKYQQNQEAFRRSDEACGINSSPFTKVGNSYEMGGSYF